MRLPSFLLLLLAAAPAWAVESLLPEARPADRYEKSLAQSPFALATVVEAPAAPTESFASNWVLTGLSRMPDDQGVSQDFVTIRSRDQRIAFSLFGAEVSNDPDAKGVSIDKVDHAANPRKSTVSLKRGAELAKVEFGQEVASPAAVAPPLGQPGRPGMPNNVLPGARPNLPGVGGGPGGVPGNRFQPGAPSTLPRPPNLVSPGVRAPTLPGAQVIAPGAQGAQAPGDHRRVRVIQSRP